MIKSLRQDVENARSRLDRSYDMSPVEITNLYTRCIETLAKWIGDNCKEMVPLPAVRALHYLWIAREKYMSSNSMKYNRLGDHNKAFHMYQFKRMLELLENMEE